MNRREFLGAGVAGIGALAMGVEDLIIGPKPLEPVQFLPSLLGGDDWNVEPELGGGGQIDADAGVIGAATIYRGLTRVKAQFDKTDTTLADVSGLSVSVAAGGVYAFKAVLHCSASSGGHKYAVAGTCTATTVRFDVLSIESTTIALHAIATSLGTGGASGNTSVVILTMIQGSIAVNVGGSLTVQFAQNSAVGTSSVLTGSIFEVKRVA